MAKTWTSCNLFAASHLELLNTLSFSCYFHHFFEFVTHVLFSIPQSHQGPAVGQGQGEDPLAFCSECQPPQEPSLSHDTTVQLHQWRLRVCVCVHALKEWVNHVCILMRFCTRRGIWANRKSTARPRWGLSGFLWPRSHVMVVVRSLGGRALSCLTFSTSPWTVTSNVTSFFLTVECVSVLLSMCCQNLPVQERVSLKSTKTLKAFFHK